MADPGGVKPWFMTLVLSTWLDIPDHYCMFPHLLIHSPWHWIKVQPRLLVEPGGVNYCFLTGLRHNNVKIFQPWFMTLVLSTWNGWVSLTTVVRFCTFWYILYDMELKTNIGYLAFGSIMVDPDGVNQCILTGLGYTNSKIFHPWLTTLVLSTWCGWVSLPIVVRINTFWYILHNMELETNLGC